MIIKNYVEQALICIAKRKIIIGGGGGKLRHHGEFVE